MRTIYNFLVDNWQLISAIIVSFISLVIALLKTRDKSKQLGLLEVFIEDMILLAEEQFGEKTGEVKKQFVLKTCKNFANKINVSISYDELSDKIEKLLGLPSKKGGK